jgi:hypothetical protein
MASLDVPGPQELKPIVWERLQENGTLRRLNKNIKIALTSAIGEMRGTRDTQSVLDNRFKPQYDVELAALQTIYQYLAEQDLTWCLQCLIDETQIPKESDAFDLIQVLDLGEDEEGEDNESLEEDEEESDE